MGVQVLLEPFITNKKSGRADGMVNRRDLGSSMQTINSVDFTTGVARKKRGLQRVL
jgi:hypothetical protein